MRNNKHARSHFPGMSTTTVNDSNVSSTNINNDNINNINNINNNSAKNHYVFLPADDEVGKLQYISLPPEDRGR